MREDKKTSLHMLAFQ